MASPLDPAPGNMLIYNAAGILRKHWPVVVKCRVCMYPADQDAKAHAGGRQRHRREMLWQQCSRGQSAYTIAAAALWVNTVSVQCWCTWPPAFLGS